MDEEEAAAFGKAIGDVTRQRILRFVAEERRNVGEIAKHVGVKQPTATHHLQLLDEAKLVVRDTAGKEVFYGINEKIFVSCCGSLLLQLAPHNPAAKAVCDCCDCC